MTPMTVVITVETTEKTVDTTVESTGHTAFQMAWMTVSAVVMMVWMSGKAVWMAVSTDCIAGTTTGIICVATKLTICVKIGMSTAAA